MSISGFEIKDEPNDYRALSEFHRGERDAANAECEELRKENDRLQRENARMRAELYFCSDKANEIAKELDFNDGRWVALACIVMRAERALSGSPPPYVRAEALDKAIEAGKILHMTDDLKAVTQALGLLAEAEFELQQVKERNKHDED